MVGTSDDMAHEVEVIFRIVGICMEHAYSLAPLLIYTTSSGRPTKAVFTRVLRHSKHQYETH